MIAVRIENGRYTPRAICDACGDPITEPHNAVVVWAMGAGPETRTPYVAHKGWCHDAIDERIKADSRTATGSTWQSFWETSGNPQHAGLTLPPYRDMLHSWRSTTARRQ